MSENHFYRDLAPFHRFVDEVFEPRFYSPLPSDWLVLVADIVASTRAVESGRYAEVNYLGAACIVAVNNVLDGLVVPTVFGGDGATVAVPPTAGQAALEALLATQRWGRGAFGLELRVGRVSVEELLRRGAVIEVAKMEFSPGNALAMFRGNGFDLADALVKGDDGRHGFLIVDQPRTAKRPDLTSLSCRWAPLASQNGVMLCVIIAAHADSVPAADAVYRDALSQLNRVVALESADSSPVKLGMLRAGVRPSAIIKEAKGAPGSWFQRWPVLVVKHVLQAFTFWFRLKPGGFDPDLYKHEMILNADFRKVSGMLRLIIDCSSAQADDIEAALAAMHAAGNLDFGTFRASRAIMTCVTPNVDNHEHVHYIDGSDGGLWRAASALKQQMAARGGNGDPFTPSEPQDG